MMRIRTPAVITLPTLLLASLCACSPADHAAAPPTTVEQVAATPAATPAATSGTPLSDAALPLIKLHYWQQEARIAAGSTVEYKVSLGNGSSETIDASGAGKVSASYLWLTPDGQVLEGSNPVSPLPSSVSPGQSVGLTVAVTAPAKPGEYFLVVGLVQEGGAWLADRGLAPLTYKVHVD